MGKHATLFVFYAACCARNLCRRKGIVPDGDIINGASKGVVAVIGKAIEQADSRSVAMEIAIASTNEHTVRVEFHVVIITTYVCINRNG